MSEIQNSFLKKWKKKEFLPMWKMPARQPALLTQSFGTFCSHWPSSCRFELGPPPTGTKPWSLHLSHSYNFGSQFSQTGYKIKEITVLFLKGFYGFLIYNHSEQRLVINLSSSPKRATYTWTFHKAFSHTLSHLMLTETQSRYNYVIL